jgi:hypothetical protein
VYVLILSLQTLAIQQFETFLRHYFAALGHTDSPKNDRIYTGSNHVEQGKDKSVPRQADVAQGVPVG